VLAVDEVVDHARLHGAGAVERDGGDDVFEAVGLELLAHLAEALRFHLEHAEGVALAMSR
jgi:hypothetical protein